jgi:hypothetical protein
MVVYKVFAKNFEFKKGEFVGMLIERRKDMRGKTQLESGMIWAKLAFGRMVKDEKTIFVVPNELKLRIHTKSIIEKGIFTKEEILGMGKLVDQKGNREDRRKHPRVGLDLPLEYRVTNIPNAYGALIVNGCEMGLLMESVKKILIGTNLKIVALFPKEYGLANLEASAEIVWRESYLKRDWRGYRYGLKFVSIAAHDQWKLRELLNGQRLTFDR